MINPKPKNRLRRHIQALCGSWLDGISPEHRPKAQKQHDCLLEMVENYLTNKYSQTDQDGKIERVNQTGDVYYLFYWAINPSLSDQNDADPLTLSFRQQLLDLVFPELFSKNLRSITGRTMMMTAVLHHEGILTMAMDKLKKYGQVIDQIDEDGDSIFDYLFTYRNGKSGVGDLTYEQTQMIFDLFDDNRMLHDFLAKNKSIPKWAKSLVEQRILMDNVKSDLDFKDSAKARKI